MTVPNYDDLKHDGRPRSNTDWDNILNRTQNYMTDGTADFTINSVTANSYNNLPGFDITSLIAGENLTAGNVLRLKVSDGKIWKADSSSLEGITNVLGISSASYSVGETVTIKKDTYNAFVGLTAGTIYYVGLAGALSTTEGAFTKQIGTALNTTTLLIDIHLQDNSLPNGFRIDKNEDGVNAEILRLNRTSASVADNDTNDINLYSENDNNQQHLYSRIRQTIVDASDTTEAGQLTLGVANGVNGSIIDNMDITSGSVKINNLAIITPPSALDGIMLQLETISNRFRDITWYDSGVKGRIRYLDANSGDAADRMRWSVGTALDVMELNPSGDLTITGAISKGSGSFDIPHLVPKKNKAGMRLRHYFVETPSAGGCLYKYQLDLLEGENTFKLPDYFKYLNTNVLIWVNPYKHFGIGYGEYIENQDSCILTVNAKGKYNVLIFGDRKDSIAMKDFNKHGIEYIKEDIKK